MQIEAMECLESSQISEDDVFLRDIEAQDEALIRYFSQAFVVDKALTRKLVSFQANKTRTHYRWYRYKEAFSADLVEYLVEQYCVAPGTILDPFAGAGTSLFAASSLGYATEGIELLPLGQKIITAHMLARSGNKEKILSALDRWLRSLPWKNEGKSKHFERLRITEGAYPSETCHKIGRYLHDLECEESEVGEMLLFALLCILESISYTRKDGQYLRWDYRSGRGQGRNTFHKGRIVSFDESIVKKLQEIKNDISLHGRHHDLFSFSQKKNKAGEVRLLKGSCFEILPQLKDCAYSGIITSPPYCNRYDYTRTYALEHAILGVNEAELLSLRQAMLSCTVENKAKALADFHPQWSSVLEICEGLDLLQKVLSFLDYKRNKKELNNNGIARMVRGYFYEMSCVIQECYRVLDQGGFMFMINDNVRYAGAAISVDAILSKIAEISGFQIENILVLPQVKGNSSQQMGKHGRKALRKCVYVWKKG